MVPERFLKIYKLNPMTLIMMEYQNILYNASPEPLTLEFINLSDTDAIQLINDTYFSNNPIEIYKL